MNNELVRALPRENREEAQGQLQRLLLDPAMEHIRVAVGRKLKSMKSADYENSAWPYFQAHQNGYNEAIEGVMKLLETKD